MYPFALKLCFVSDRLYQWNLTMKLVAGSLASQLSVRSSTPLGSAPEPGPRQIKYWRCDQCGGTILVRMPGWWSQSCPLPCAWTGQRPTSWPVTLYARTICQPPKVSSMASMGTRMKIMPALLWRLSTTIYTVSVIKCWMEYEFSAITILLTMAGLSELGQSLRPPEPGERQDY